MPGGRRTAWGVVAASAVVALLALLVALPWRPLASADDHTDRDVHRWLLSHQGLITAARGLTHLGDPLVVTALSVAVAVALLVTGRRRAALYVLLVRLLAIVVSSLVKDAVGRPRPVLSRPFVHAHGPAFPSGHALGSAALWVSVAVVLAHRLPGWGVGLLAAAVPVVVATTRVLLGVHFVTDVVSGLLLGAVVALAVALPLAPASGVGRGAAEAGAP